LDEPSTAADADAMEEAHVILDEPSTAADAAAESPLWVRAAAAALWTHWVTEGQFELEGRPFRFLCTE
jgi:hypothetical protein